MKRPICKVCGTVEATLDTLHSHFRSEHAEYYKAVQDWLGPESSGSDTELYTEPQIPVDPEDHPNNWAKLRDEDGYVVDGAYRRKKLAHEY